MEFVQKISQQLVDPGDQTGSSKDYVVLGESYPAITGHQDKEVSSGFLNGFFSRPESQNPQFLSDVHSRLHFTYRTKFVPTTIDIRGYKIYREYEILPMSLCCKRIYEETQRI